jgi:hypothetical protein
MRLAHNLGGRLLSGSRTRLPKHTHVKVWDDPFHTPIVPKLASIETKYCYGWS